MDLKLQKQASPWRKTVIVLIIFLIFSILELAYNFPRIATPLEKLELAARDTAMRVRGLKPVDDRIVIVDIDDQSLAWVGERWPWSRSRMAEIVRWLNAAGAEVIAFDIFLFDPSSDPQDDEDLAQAFAESQAVVTVSQVFETPFSQTHITPESIFLPVIDGYGLTEIQRDDDAVVRSILAYKNVQGETIYNWGFRIVQAALDANPPDDPSLAWLYFNGTRVPLNQRGHLLIDFRGPARTYPTYPAAFLLEGDYDPALFQGKIVLIGSSSETLQDIYPTPFSTTNLTPGVEIVANVVDTLLSQSYLRLSPPWMTIAILLALAVIARLLAESENPTSAVIFGAVALLAYLVLRQVAFTRAGLVLSIISPALMISLGVVLPAIDQTLALERERRRVRGLFSQFISPQMVDQLLETQDIDSLNKRTELTILFSDLRGFTTLSEQMSPEELVNLLNPYLERMTTIIHKHGGTVDKYEGDAIIAFFGEPIPFQDHAIRAVRAAIEMRQALRRLNQTWQTHGILNQTLEMGIGIHTGEVFVGLLGSQERITYTVIGDAVNLAARLQDKTKEHGYPILLSGVTRQALTEEFQPDFVESSQVKGRSEPVEIYRLKAE
jgi:adenylate cyclase